MSEINYTITGWAGTLVGALFFVAFMAWLFILPALGFFWLLGWLK